MKGSLSFVSLNSRIESNKEEEKVMKRLSSAAGVKLDSSYNTFGAGNLNSNDFMASPVSFRLVFEAHRRLYQSV